jgi:hypothetical protein
MVWEAGMVISCCSPRFDNPSVTIVLVPRPPRITDSIGSHEQSDQVGPYGICLCNGCFMANLLAAIEALSSTSNTLMHLNSYVQCLPRFEQGGQLS